LICRFCSQWNLPTAQRCCFCANPLGGTEDRTVAGGPTAVQPAVTAPHHQPRAAGPLPRPLPVDDDLLSGLRHLGRRELGLLALAVLGLLLIVRGFVRC